MANGVLWPALFQGDEDNIRKILYGSWLWRDWDFDNTSLTGFTPFDDDGNLVDTLFSPDNPGGPWYDVGYMDEKGPTFNQKFTNKPTRSMQTRWPTRWDYTGQTEEISATLQESNPVVDAIRDNKPLSNLQSVGTIGYSSSEPVERDILWRQCLFIGVDGRSGQNYYVVRVYPKVLPVDFGNTSWNIDTVDELPVHCQAIPDPYSTSPDGEVGAPRWILRGGPAWRALGESVFEIGAPDATAVSGLKATLTFPTPAGLESPISYTASQQLTPTGSFTPATISGTPSTSGGNTTITVSGLTANTTYNAFKVTATGSDSTAITSAPSNSITTTAS